MRPLPQPRRYNLSQLVVVVVDDCPIMLKLLTLMLNAMDISQVHCTTDPERALEDIASYRPHLVITDLLMKPIDGFTMTKVIRFCRDEELRFTPIFALSAFTDREHVLQARDAGVNEVLAKPVSVKTIYQRIQVLIEQSPSFVDTGVYFGPDRRILPERDLGQSLQVKQAPEEENEVLYIDVG